MTTSNFFSMFWASDMDGLASLKPDFLGARLPADLLQGCRLEDILTTFCLLGGAIYRTETWMIAFECLPLCHTVVNMVNHDASIFVIDLSDSPPMCA